MVIISQLSAIQSKKQQTKQTNITGKNHRYGGHLECSVGRSQGENRGNYSGIKTHKLFKYKIDREMLRTA